MTTLVQHCMFGVQINYYGFKWVQNMIQGYFFITYTKQEDSFLVRKKKQALYLGEKFIEQQHRFQT